MLSVAKIAKPVDADALLGTIVQADERQLAEIIELNRGQLLFSPKRNLLAVLSSGCGGLGIQRMVVLSPGMAAAVHRKRLRSLEGFVAGEQLRTIAQR